MLIPVALISAIIGIRAGSGNDDGAEVAVTEDESPTLPGGGVKVFPKFRVIAFDGAPQQPALGPIGRNSPEDAAVKLKRQARPYRAGGRPLLPAFHLIATVAQADAGDDGLYRARLDPPDIERYLEVARDNEMLLLLDIQPGQADFIDEVRALEPLLREPEVGIALDPEWNMAPGEVPGSVIGTVDAAEVNEVSSYMEEIARDEDLPQKVLVVHQFTSGMITNRDRITDRSRVAVAFSIDGFGSPALKKGVYRRLAPRNKRSGFKVFYEEDVPLMSPRDVLGQGPQPQIVIYE